MCEETLRDNLVMQSNPVTCPLSKRHLVYEIHQGTVHKLGEMLRESKGNFTLDFFFSTKTQSLSSLEDDTNSFFGEYHILRRIQLNFMISINVIKV